MSKNYLFLLALVLFYNFGYSQLFEEITEPAFQGVFYGDCAAVDLNNDNRKDIMFSGAIAGYATGNTTIYTNTADGYSLLEEAFSQIMYSAITTGDLDGNGFTDILISGVKNEPGTPQAQVFEIYYNNGDGTFNQDATTGILPVTYGSLEIADFNNDGIKDILVNGNNTNGYISKIYYQEEGNTFVDSGIALMGTYFSDTKVFDANADGFPDILITGFNTSYVPDTILYINQQDGTFIEQESGLANVYFSSIDVYDINGDGKLDVLLSGMSPIGETYAPILRLYENDGEGNFTATDNEFMGTYGGTSSFVDYNKDGLLDVFTIGSNAGGQNTALLYTNNGDGTFTEDSGNSEAITGLNMSKAVWFDMDNDMDMDLLTIGFSGNQGFTKLYKNTLFTQETPCNQEPGNNVGDTGCATFIYKGVQTTYTTVRSADGNIWIQQNLGSEAIATSATDADSFGDLFQWGRWDDGHQSRNSEASSTAANPNNPAGLVAGEAKFYLSDPEWWDGGSATDTWEAATPDDTTDINGCDPCKALGQGWRMPTEAEWEAVIEAENITNIATAFQSNLKLTVAGARSTSGVYNAGVRGYYWSKTISATNASFAKYLYYSNAIVNPNAGGFREQGSSIRCLRNAAEYCAVSVDYDIEPISLVSFGDIYNETSAVVNATPTYEDFTDMSTDLEKGETYNLTVKGNTVGFEHDIRVFLDWNQDKVFDMETEYYTVSLLPSTGADNVVASLDITIPNNAALGNTRMRIIKDQWNIYEEGEFDACLNAYYGQVEDYTINIIGAIIDNPVTAITVTTENNLDAAISEEAGTLQLIATATPAEGNQEVSWSVASGATFATVDNNGLVTALQNGIVTIKAVSAENSSIFGQIQIEITNQPIAFCIPVYGSGVEPITSVAFADLENTSSNATNSPQYEDFTSLVATVSQGDIHTLTVKGNTDGASYINFIHVYFDWDNSRTFEENEGLSLGYIQGSNGMDDNNATAEITIPDDAFVGEIRMRVLKRYASSADPLDIAACNNGGYGQAEDYTINIQENLGTGNFSKNNLKIYPNPTTGFVTVQTETAIKNIQVFNQLGQLITTQKDSKINLSGVATGIYLIQITLDDDTAVTQKIIKK